MIMDTRRDCCDEHQKINPWMDKSFWQKSGEVCFSSSVSCILCHVHCNACPCFGCSFYWYCNNRFADGLDNVLAVNTTILIIIRLPAAFLLPVQCFTFADMARNGYCKPNAFMEGGFYMEKNQIHVMTYHSTDRIPLGQAETIRAPNCTKPLRGYSLFGFVV